MLGRTRMGRVGLKGRTGSSRAVALVAVAVVAALVAAVLEAPALARGSDLLGRPAARTVTHVDQRSVPPRETVRILQVVFRAKAGERRLITAKVYARQPRTTGDPVLMAAVSMGCSPRARGVRSAGSTQNLVRGHRSLLTPRFVYRVPRTGRVACTVYATGERPRPHRGGARRNAWRVSDGSYIAVSQPLRHWSRSIGTSARSRVVRPHRQWSPISTRVWIGAGRSFQLLADHKVTTCSSPGGSKDSTTQGRNLCRFHVRSGGTRVRSRITVVQLDRRGHACAPRQVFLGSRMVTPSVHHAMLFQRERVRVARRKGCTQRFWIRSTLLNSRGATMMVHAPSERLAVLPRVVR